MRVIARKTLSDFWSEHPSAERPLRAWFREAIEASWADPMDVKKAYRSASILQDGRVVFNIHGNSFRLVVWVNYDYKTVYIRFVGTHAEYDEIDAQTV